MIFKQFDNVENVNFDATAAECEIVILGLSSIV